MKWTGRRIFTQSPRPTTAHDPVLEIKFCPVTQQALLLVSLALTVRFENLPPQVWIQTSIRASQQPPFPAPPFR